MKKSLILSMVLFLSIVMMKETQAQDIKLTELDLNRQAVKLTGDKKKEFPLTDQGFLWQKDDSKTKNWRPQGVTGITKDDREFIIVSWYGRPKSITETVNKIKVKVPTGATENYKNRGARLSIVDLTSLKYRHVLLVDKEKATYPDMHAGGIAVIGNMIHVADSRKGHGVIRVYDLNKIQKLAKGKEIHKYPYILIEEYNYKAPIKPSFISYDREKEQILIGTFAESPSDAKPNLLAWYNAPKNASEASSFTTNIDKVSVYRISNDYKKIQGMASSKGADGKTILWLSTSFGRDKRGNFYTMNIDINESTPKSPAIYESTKSSSRKYPPGLEDAYISPNNKLWLLTEFAYMEGVYKGGVTRRAVFGINKSDIEPK